MLFYVFRKALVFEFYDISHYFKVGGFIGANVAFKMSNSDIGETDKFFVFRMLNQHPFCATVRCGFSTDCLIELVQS